MTAKEWGEEFTEGVLITLGKYLIYGLISIGLLTIAFNSLELKTDDTDISSWKRSGLELHTDARTGLQYLSDGKGGLTVRLDATGKPLGSR